MFTASPIVASPSWTTYDINVWLALHAASSSRASSSVSVCWQFHNLIKKTQGLLVTLWRFYKQTWEQWQWVTIYQHCEGNWVIKAVHRSCRKEDYYSHCICILRCPSNPEAHISASEALIDLGQRIRFLLFALYSSKRSCQWRGYWRRNLIPMDCFRSILVLWADNCNKNRKID